MIDIPKANRTRHDVYLLFKRIEDVHDYLAHKDVAEKGRFRAEDYIDFHTTESQMNGVSHNSRNTLTIITAAMLDFADGDYIYDVKYKLIWRITPGGVQVADDGQMKEYSLRPRKDSILSLTR